MLYLVEVTYSVPVWAASADEARALARGCWSLRDYDCGPLTGLVIPCEGACDLDEAPIGGKGRALRDLLREEPEG